MYTMFTLREFPFFVRLISHATLTSTETRCLHLPHEVKLLDLTPRDLLAKGLTFRKTYWSAGGGDEGCLPGYEGRIG